MDVEHKHFLKALLSQPTAPFREMHVFNIIKAYFKEHNVPCFFDPAGNLVVGVSSKTAYLELLNQRSDKPLRILMAHADHPGFHGVRWQRDGSLHVNWYGGSPIKHIKGSEVWLANDRGFCGRGKFVSAQVADHGFSLSTGRIVCKALAVQKKQFPADNLFGSFTFRAPVWFSGQRIYTHAADDLIGVFCIAMTARKLLSQAKQNAGPFLGLITRAEEVGFVGALAHLRLGWWQRAQRPLMAVSLEASRALPGANIGSGPVIRLGDRRTLFNTNGSQALTRIAEKVIPGHFQRRIMDGGSCEGTATTAFGIPTVAISIPLGNYHNQGMDGGQDYSREGAPAPEFVNIKDVTSMVALCEGIMKYDSIWKNPWEPIRKKLLTSYKDYSAMLN